MTFRASVPASVAAVLRNRRAKRSPAHLLRVDAALQCHGRAVERDSVPAVAHQRTRRFCLRKRPRGIQHAKGCTTVSQASRDRADGRSAQSWFPPNVVGLQRIARSRQAAGRFRFCFELTLSTQHTPVLVAMLHHDVLCSNMLYYGGNMLHYVSERTSPEERARCSPR